MLGAIILSAGQARRMGTLKQLLPWQGGQTVLDTVIKNTLACPDIDGPVILVLGAGAQAIRPALAPVSDSRLYIVENSDWPQGMLSSIKAGLGHLPPDCQGFMLILGDQPLVSCQVISALAAHFKAGSAPLIIPTFDGRRGHPVVVHRRFLPEIQSLTGDVGLRELVNRYGQQVCYFEVGNQGILIDLDCPGDYAKYRPQAGRGLILLRGAGEMASGIAHRLYRAGFSIIMQELPSPLAVRRPVSFAQAVFSGRHTIEGVTAVRARDKEECLTLISIKKIALLVGEPDMASLDFFRPSALVDATLAKRNTGITREMAPVVVGVGPGFEAGLDVDAVVESQRGHDLGRVYYTGRAAPDTGLPGQVGGYTYQRVVRAPKTGVFQSPLTIGSTINAGELIGQVDEEKVFAAIPGILRGLVQPGTWVEAGVKVGDIDPRGIAEYCTTISEKARAIAGGVLEAILCLEGGVKP